MSRAPIPKTVVESFLVDAPEKWSEFDIQVREAAPERTLLAIDAEWHDDRLCLVQIAFAGPPSSPNKRAPPQAAGCGAKTHSSSSGGGGAARPITVVTIDCLTLDAHEVQRRLRPIVCDVRFRKLVFDCREDSRMLVQQLGLAPAGLFDLQLLELVTRPHLVSQKAIQNVRGLKSLIAEFPSLAEFIEAKSGHDLTRVGSSAVFMQRPLAPATLEYASCDVAALFALFDELQQRPKYREGPGRCADLTMRGSIRYAMVNLAVPNEYRRHNMLPLDVLPELAPAQGPRECGGCCRPVAARDRQYCVVCHAHVNRQQQQAMPAVPAAAVEPQTTAATQPEACRPFFMTGAPATNAHYY